MRLSIYQIQVSIFISLFFYSKLLPKIMTAKKKKSLEISKTSFNRLISLRLYLRKKRSKTL